MHCISLKKERQLSQLDTVLLCRVSENNRCRGVRSVDYNLALIFFYICSDRQSNYRFNDYEYSKGLDFHNSTIE